MFKSGGQGFLQDFTFCGGGGGEGLWGGGSSLGVGGLRVITNKVRVLAGIIGTLTRNST